MSLNILMFGRSGQVATELARRAAPGIEVTALGRDQADLGDPGACAAAVEASEADVVINAAAYTAVDKAEDDQDLAHKINAEAPGAMARACAAQDVPFLHISTDYVFDGSGTRPWREDDPTGPLGAYGRTKLAGEEAVLAAGGPSAILRTSWVFSAHGANFVKTMLRVGDERDHLKVVADQHGAPTAAADIADALLLMAQAFGVRSGVGGVFHFASQPQTTWHGFASEIFAQADWIDAPEVEAITTDHYPTPAARPANSRLDCSHIHQTYGISQPDWRASLADVLADLKEATP